MESEETKLAGTAVAPGLQESSKIAEFPQPEKRRRKSGFQPGENLRNQYARTHGFYSQQWTEEEKAARLAWIQEMLDEKGNPSFAERSLITTASWLNAISTRAFTAMEEGRGAPDHQHLLSIVNSYRLIMCALGLKQKEEEENPVEAIQKHLAKKTQKEGAGACG